MTTLYELTDKFRELNRLAESEDIPAEVIRDTVEGLEGDWEAKAINVAKFVLNAEALAESIKAKEKQMADRRKRLEGRAESLRQYMLFNFQALGKTKLVSELFELAVKNNPPSVVVDDINAVPDEFLKSADAPPMPPEKGFVVVETSLGNEIIGQADGINDVPIGWHLIDAGGNIIQRGTIEYVPAEADKTAIRAEFKAGREVAGCHPEQGQRLDIVVG